IRWEELPVRVAKDAVEWPRSERRRIAGVSSFGISGTNAHVVLEEGPPREEESRIEPPARGAELVVVSAKSAAALEEAARRLGAHLEVHPELALGGVAYSLATTRTHHEHRLALAVDTREALVTALEVAARGETPTRSVRGGLGPKQGKVGWLFT